MPVDNDEWTILSKGYRITNLSIAIITNHFESGSEQKKKERM